MNLILISILLGGAGFAALCRCPLGRAVAIGLGQVAGPQERFD